MKVIHSSLLYFADYSTICLMKRVWSVVKYLLLNLAGPLGWFEPTIVVLNMFVMDSVKAFNLLRTEVGGF